MWVTRRIVFGICLVLAAGSFAVADPNNLALQHGRDLQSGAITSLVLIDVPTNREILEISNNMVIDRRALGLTTMNIKANASGDVKSVKFALNANANFRTENSAPYAMCGDSNAIYTACKELVPGTFSVQAIPYSLTNAAGTMGQSMTLTFTIIDGTPTAPVAAPVPAPGPAPVTVPAPITAPVPIPVPFPTLAPVVVPVPKAAPTTSPIVVPATVAPKAVPTPSPIVAPAPIAPPAPVPTPVSAPVSVPTPVAAPVPAPIVLPSPVALPPVQRTDGLTNLRLISVPNTVVMDLKLNGEPNYVTVEALGLKNFDFNIMALGTEGVVSVVFDNGRDEKSQPFARCGDSSGNFFKCADISAEGIFTVSATGKLLNGANTNTIRATIIVSQKGTAAPTTSVAPSFAPTTSAPTVSAAPTMTKTCSTPKFVGSWQPIMKYPTTVSEAQGAMIGTDFVIISGFDKGVSVCTDKVYALNTADPLATWREMDKLPSYVSEGITHGAFALIGTKLYMCGGYYGGHPGPAIDNCLIYDHAAKKGSQWSSFQSLPAPRSGGGMTYDRRLKALVFAGGAMRPFPKVNPKAIDKNDAWMLKLEWIGDSSKSWVPVKNIPYHANHMSYATLSDEKGREHHIFVGGQVDENEFTGNVKGNWEYDYAKNQWIKLADMPFTRGHASSSTRAISCGYTMSGGSTNEFGKTTSVIYYDFPTNTWSNVGELNSAINTPVCDYVTHASTGKTWYYCNKGWSGSWRREVVLE